MRTVSVKLVPLGKLIRAREGTPLIDILHEYGIEFPCGGKGSCGKCKVKVLEGEIEADSQHLEKLRKLDLGEDWRLACLSRCSGDLVLEIGQYENIILADESTFVFTPGSGLGIAFDLGTTTLVGQLLDLSTGRILSVETALNPQSPFGSDLITRLETALRDGGNELTRIIREKIGELVGKMMEGQEAPLERMVIVGNTVMHHLFSGYDIKALSFYPFETSSLDLASFSSGKLGWKHVYCDHVDFYPSIGSFVGSDILAGILAAGMHRKDGYSLLIDLGTNGEIVLGNKEHLLCASTAAGPAFEGARITQGMLATTGAISSLSGNKDSWVCKVIGNGASRGICGSGLIDAVAVLLENGLIGEFGEIISGETEIALDSRVSLTQKDIQEFQLAKAAIAAGIEILITKLGISHEEVEEVYIAGGFGSYINLENVIQLGMMDFRQERIHKLGNTALTGAKMFLFELTNYPDLILNICSHISLESEPGFQDVFVDKLAFLPR